MRIREDVSHYNIKQYNMGQIWDVASLCCWKNTRLQSTTLGYIPADRLNIVTTGAEIVEKIKKQDTMI